ncbi:MAG: elongation factor G [Desulfonatronovibrionaceae bacterium]
MDRSSLKADYLQKIRNIGVIAHIDAGKTTLTERMLYYSRRIHRLGEVHEGTATMDYLPDEQERGITIGSACTTCDWRGHTVNIIDTPGHVDFTIEVDRALRVLDGAVGVFCAVGGVEPQSETVWKQSVKYHIPKIAIVNKMDRVGADFEGAIRSMREKLSIVPLPVQVPLGQGEDFYAVADVLEGKKYIYDQAEYGARYEVQGLESQEEELVLQWRNIVIEGLADFSDELMESYLEGKEIGPEMIRSEFRKACLRLECVPVLACSALKNTGVQPVMDAICAYLPSPSDVPQISGIDPETKTKKEVGHSRKDPLVCLAFKITMETGRKMVLLRIYAGEIEPGQEIYNATQGLKQRVSRLFFLHAERKEKTDLAVAGQIVAVAGLKDTSTGDTLCSYQDQIILERISRYKPVISQALEPQNSEQEDKLLEALDRLIQEDPTLSVERNKDTEQIILSGMGELHLEVVTNRIRRDFEVNFRSGNPQVVYQETIRETAAAERSFARELGERFHAGAVRLQVEPRPRSSGVNIYFACDTEGFSRKIQDSVFSGIQDGLQAGVLKGYPVHDLAVAVQELIAVSEGGSEVGYRMAAITALKAALKEAGPVLLEPIMWVEIHSPEEFVGECMGLLGSKGARVDNMFERVSGEKVIQAFTPLKNMFGFTTELRSATQGRATLIMKFDRFDAADF